MNRTLLLITFVVTIFSIEISAQGITAKLPSYVSSEMLKKQISSIDKDKLFTSKTERYDDSLINMSVDTVDTNDAIPKESQYYNKMMKNHLVNPDSLTEDITLFGYYQLKNSQLNRSRYKTVSNIPNSYRVASGDVINILLWGRINDEYNLTVTGKGYINIPRIGPVYVAGISFRGVKSIIDKKVSSIEGVNATVAMGTLSDIKISVVGEVNNPGQYALSALSNIVDAIVASGGVSKVASLRRVEIRRNGVLRKRVDLYKYLLSGNNFGNIRFNTGDVVFVPVAKNLITVSGNIRRAGVYELTGKSNLKELLALSGDFTAAADKKRVQIERYEGSKKIIVDVDYTDGSEGSFKLKDGDWVKIFPVRNLYKQSISLSGSVKNEGRYEFRDGMHIADVIGSFDDLKYDTYLKYSIIKRRDSTGTTSRIISFNLGEAISESESNENILLSPGDSILVFQKSFFEPERLVYIGGEVTSQDNYPISDNMSIKDLILMAGGLKDDASSVRGELYRRNYVDDSASTVKIDFNVSDAMTMGDSENFKLKKFDAVYIRSKLGWQESKRVVLVGEFNYPGEYIALENETLDELVQRAGGIKGDADLKASVFVRKSVKILEKKRLDNYVTELQRNMLTLTSEMTARGNLTPELLSVIELQRKSLEKLKDTDPVGRVVLDLENDFGEDFKLEDGDTLYLPKETNLVSVIGEVFNPATFRLNKRGSTVRDYIERSGGYRVSSDKNKTYIIKANGSVVTQKMVNMRRYSLESGDAIVVPKKVPYNNGRFKIFMNTLEVITRLSTITANTVSTVALIKNLK